MKKDAITFAGLGLVLSVLTLSIGACSAGSGLDTENTIDPVWIDTDGDGLADGIDIDGDGVVDIEAEKPDNSEPATDETEHSDPVWVDTDGDGVGDGLDTNGDGKIDIVAEEPAESFDPVWIDTDGDGVGDGLDTDGDGKIDIVSMQFIHVTGITTASPAEYTLFVGKSIELNYTVEPATASNKSIIWTTSDPSVAFVSNGHVRGVSPGTASVKAVSEDGGFELSFDFSISKKCIAGDATKDDEFAHSVSISGDTAVIGAPYANGSVSSSGAVYIFTQNQISKEWTQTQKLVATDGALFDGFGFSVSISGDTIVIGTPYNGSSNSGSVYIFVRNEVSGLWDMAEKILASDAATDNVFGSSVAVSEDLIVVGASTGFAYAFAYNSETGHWDEHQKITATDVADTDDFGVSVSISENIIGVGASGDEDSAGSVYIFTYNTDTELWEEKQKLIAADATAGALFGISLSISVDTILVGARDASNNGSQNGAAYIFTQNPNSKEWTQTQKLAADDGAAADNFGSSVALSGDIALIGASHDDDNGDRSGSAYIYQRNTKSGIWTQAQKIIAADGTSHDKFGVALSMYETNLLIGASCDDSGGQNAGSAYIYKVD